MKGEQQLVTMPLPQGKILIVDDNEELLYALQLYLSPHFKKIDILKSPKQLLNQLEKDDYDLILLDMNFKAGTQTGNEGLYWMSRILERDPTSCVVLITAYGDVELAVNALKEGATDFIQKSWDEEKILSSILSAYQKRKSKMKIKRLRSSQQHLTNQIDNRFPLVIGKSLAMERVMETVHKVASTDANILLTGENGTGKEVVARAIHHLSKRKDQLFVGVDVGSLSETLFESELFGAKKGAYTDLHDDRVGRMVIATGGTLFLDEIGNISTHLQTKLLGVIQNREVTPLGANHPTSIDVRLISATNKNLHKMVTEGGFREDLLYRINTILIELPPLRERKEDIPVLAKFFLQKYADHYQKGNLELHPAAEKKLLAHSWPGNVRELQHVMEKAAILCSGNLLTADYILPSGSHTGELLEPNNFSLTDHERILIVKALESCGGNISKAAQMLGINRSTLYDKMKRHGI